MDTKHLTTLGLVRRGGDILLIRRKREPNKGLFVAPGGKIRLRESPHECVLREVEEETGLEPTAAKLCAIITQVAPVRGQQWMLFVYRIDRFRGRLRGTPREGAPTWVSIRSVVHGDLPIPEADRVFMPRLLGRQVGVLSMKFEHRKDLSVGTWKLE
ncbi:MAG: 8-oxo-dGTP diphosphatase [Planctomycetota bacterium]|nr:8-oxo-dGTP diphosphatase [Planctomycetota bacterium]